MHHIETITAWATQMCLHLIDFILMANIVICVPYKIFFTVPTFHQTEAPKVLKKYIRYKTQRPISRGYGGDRNFENKYLPHPPQCSKPRVKP
jgi:hypothetical protein